MPADEDIGIDEKRVYDGDERETTVYVAASTGVVAVSVVEERVGGFELAVRCTARDVASGPAGLAVATDDAVLLDAGDGARSTAGDSGERFVETGFGAASAVAVHGDDVLAATDDGAVARYRDGEWRDLGELTAVARMDGDLLATADGVYRALEGSLRHAGLASATDVAAAGVPLATTSEGLFQLGNGWMDVADGDFRFVASDPGAADGRLGRAHAGTDDVLYAHHDGDWSTATQLDRPIVDVAYGDTVYAVSEDGRFAAEGPDGWRHQELGVRDVTAAVARTTTE
ncbi:HVO_0234 family beta-propeller protein [Halorubellus litoreus]|uniref:HVO-0234-like beta-propeller domain-containing protein n=1 Tax=Halorubellus litoreus TaxID=755308 RepID=A0ABD5V9M2_9EURY